MKKTTKPKRFRAIQLYYITHFKNVPSILERGILSHECVEAEGVSFEPIYDRQIVASRQSRSTPNGKSLWSFANLYFQPRNPMLYRVLCERGSMEEIVVLAVDYGPVSKMPGVYISTGNAASSLSGFFPSSKAREAFSQFREAIDMVYWKEEDGSKRKIMAECLVPDVIPPERIKCIYAPSHNAAEKLRTFLEGSISANIVIIPEPRMFFQPSRRLSLTNKLSLVEGDMFFSRTQTVTVSVNVVGVMGKGLASRAKYQFPDVYVKYQDVCRNRALRMGKPYIYKRESSFDYQLADEPETLSSANSETWFLLFATKKHWRDRASIEGIEEGLQWLSGNYRAEGIESLAIPALGCGLGWLKWRDVGPLLCRYLAHFDIPVQIYLPAEKRVPDEELSKDLLLRGSL